MKWIGLPSEWRTRSTSWPQVTMGVPSIEIILSPSWSPARSAGVPMPTSSVTGDSSGEPNRDSTGAGGGGSVRGHVGVIAQNGPGDGSAGLNVLHLGVDLFPGWRLVAINRDDLVTGGDSANGRGIHRVGGLLDG